MGLVADIDTVGGMGCDPTPTDADAVAEPPAPVHVIVYVLFEVRLFCTSLPETAFVPVQSPLAEQNVALAEVQVRVDELPNETLVGFAMIDTVGGVGGVTETTVELTLPTLPKTVSVVGPAQVEPSGFK